jgi:hypothetical protein
MEIFQMWLDDNALCSSVCLIIDRKKIDISLDDEVYGIY